MLEEFGLALPLIARGDGRFDFEVPDGWQQGRGAFGGLVLAALSRAIEAQESGHRDTEARPLRTLDAALGGPLLPGRAEIHTTARRRGKALSTWSAQLVQGGTVVAEALAVCGHARRGIQGHGFVMPPEPTPWAQVPVVELAPPLAPAFTRHFEFRNLGAAPFSGGENTNTAGWVRPRFVRRRHDTAELLALTDAWWPAALCAETDLVPMSTVSFQWSRYGTPVDDAPLYHEGRVLAAGDGFFTEERLLWDAAGQLLAVNHQTFAVG